MTSEPDRPLLLFPIGIGTYQDSRLVSLDVEREIDRVTALLEPYGGREVAWPVTMDERGGDAVSERLREWADQHADHDSLLYWVGHGWSNTEQAALAHHRSPAVVETSGLLPDNLAGAIANRQLNSPESWTIVVVDACKSARFVQLVSSILDHRPDPPRRVLLVGVSGRGATWLGSFTAALSYCLTGIFRADETIDLHDLAGELDVQLTDGHVDPRSVRRHALIRNRSPRLPLPVTVDIDNEIRALPADVRRHFLPKAQGGETGELLWFFEGREPELRTIAAWLHAPGTDLLIVTGEPGTGKSALLGQVLARTHTDLISSLSAAGLVAPVPRDELPPPGALAASVLLTGLTIEDAIRRLAADLSFGAPPAVAVTLDQQVAWLSAALAETARPPRTGRILLLDALDEAQQPTAVAGLVARLAAAPGVHVVIGTRRSSKAGLDRPDDGDNDLLDALRSGPATSEVITVSRDPAALGRYASRRLRAVFGDDKAPLIEALAFGVTLVEKEFLFARLVVHELVARPELLTADPAGELARLLGGDHRALFAAAVDRLSRRNPAYRMLLDALAHGLGRGVPIRDRILVTIAQAVAAVAVGPSADDLDALLADAAPYLMLDFEAGQTVYRLAHHTFREHLQAVEPTTSPERHRRILEALVRLAETVTDELNPYVTRHLSSHATQAGAEGLSLLDRRPDLIDRLDPHAVAFDLFRTTAAKDHLPSLLGIQAARHQLLGASPADRTGIRQIAMARHAAVTAFDPTPAASPAGWTVRWAHFAPRTPHVHLAEGTGPIRALIALPGPDGRVLLASAGYGERIPLWDPFVGEVVGFLRGHAGQTTMLASLPQRDGRALLASGGADGTVRLWNPVNRQPVDPTFHGHSNRISALAAGVRANDEHLVASASTGDMGDATVWLWYPDDDRSSRTAPQVGEISALAVVTGSDGRTLVAAASDDARIRFWDAQTGLLAAEPHDGASSGRVWALVAVPQPDGPTLLASGGDDEAIRLWDPTTGEPVGAPLAGHTGRVGALAVVPGPDGRPLLASAGNDATIRLRDMTTGLPFGAPLTGHTLPITALAVVPDPTGHPRLASASSDATIRLWDLTAAHPTRFSGVGHVGKIWDLIIVYGRDGEPMVASAGEDATVRLWDLATGRPHTGPLNGHTRPVTALATVSVDGRALLASAGADATIRLWDPLTGTPVARPMPGHLGWVRAMVAIRGTDGRPLLASADDEGTIRIWDVDTARLVGPPLIGHPGPITDLSVLSDPSGTALLASAGEEGTIRFWDVGSGEPVGLPTVGHAGRISSLAVLSSPDGETIVASGGDDGTVRMWDPDTGDPYTTAFVGHRGGITAMSVLVGHDGRPLLASASVDRTIKLWDMAGRCRRTVPVDVRIQSLRSIEDGLVLAGDDGIARLSLGGGTGPEVPAAAFHGRPPRSERRDADEE